jgi:hypothetical protein
MRFAGLLVAVLSVAAAVPACRKNKPAPPAAGAPARPGSGGNIIKIWVTADGYIKLDGKLVDLAAAEAAIGALDKNAGVVFYGRDRAREAPHPNGAKLIELIVARGVPVRLSSKPDFSDAIGPGE